MKMNKKGFTLIEMLAVIAIIAVLVAIIVPAVGSSTTKAKASTDAANLRSVLSAATIEYAAEGKLDALKISVPECKSVPTATNIEIYKDGDELIAYFVAGTTTATYYDVNSFSDVAEGATASGGAEITTPQAATKSATATKVWPVTTTTPGEGG